MRILWKCFIKKTDLPYLNFHGLGHSCATYLIKQGVNIKVIQDLLGHSNVSITLNMYTHTKITDLENE